MKREKKLVLRKETIDLLDGRALEEAKGGSLIIATVSLTVGAVTVSLTLIPD